MSMFLTPGLKPFYGGTYFPPDDRYGRPGFVHVLSSLARVWSEQRDLVEEQAGNLTRTRADSDCIWNRLNKLLLGLICWATPALRLSRAFDPQHGGFGAAPKFPHPMDLRLLLRLHRRFGDEQAMAMVRRTCDAMALGGIYDHLGGGFHRYSTDAHWLVPHFEKMLYDNALLASAYLEAFQVTGDPLYRQVVDETLAYVLREMTSPGGPFTARRTPTAKASRASSSSGRGRRSSRFLAKRRPSCFASFTTSRPKETGKDTTFCIFPAGCRTTPSYRESARTN